MATKITAACAEEDLGYGTYYFYCYLTKKLLDILQEELADKLIMDWPYTENARKASNGKPLFCRTVIVDDASAPNIKTYLEQPYPSDRPGDREGLCTLRNSIKEKLLDNLRKKSDIDVVERSKEIFDTPILGEWRSKSRQIIIYIKNIKNVAQNDDKKEVYLLVSTMLHELTHAYLDVPETENTYITLLEEPLCEAGMLNFLADIKDFKNKGDWDQTYSDGYSYCKERVKSKECGLMHYALGAYLHEAQMMRSSQLYGLDLTEKYHKVWTKAVDVKATTEVLRSGSRMLAKSIFMGAWPGDALCELRRIIVGV